MVLEPLSPDLLERLPVFPLPATVLFPGTALPLHVFEPRYVALTEHCLQAGGAIAIAMLLEDSDPMAVAPPLHSVACAGRIVHHERLPNGRYNILVHGLQRVRLVRELGLTSGFRSFAAEPLVTSGADEAAPELARLQSCVLSLRRSVAETDEQLVEVLRTTADPVALADILGAVLVTDPDTRQRLLASENLRDRLRLLIDAVAEVMVRVGEPPAAAKMN